MHRSLKRKTIAAAAILCAWSFVAVGAELAPAEQSATLQPPPAPSWRGAQSSGLNCLYLQLHLSGYRGDYETFRNVAGDAASYRTLKSLQRLGRQLGMESDVVRLSADQLDGLRVPAVLHVESQGVSSGDFVFFLRADNVRGPWILDGFSLAWRLTTREELNRSWSGYALVPRSPPSLGDTVRRSGAGFSFMLVIAATVSAIWRYRKRLSNPDLGGATAAGWRTGPSIPLLYVLLVAPAVCRAEPVALPDAIGTALQENARALNPFTIKWFEECHYETGKSDHHSMRLTFQDGKIYYGGREGVGSRPEKERWHSYDGSNWYDYDHAPAQTFYKGRIDRQDGREFNWGYYFGPQTGLTPPPVESDMIAARCVSTLLRVLQNNPIQSITNVRRDGLDLVCIRLSVENMDRAYALRWDLAKLEQEARDRGAKEDEVGRFHEAVTGRRSMPAHLIELIYLSPDKHYAQVRTEERYEDGTLLRERVNADFQRLGGRDVWLPRKSVENTYWDDTWDGMGKFGFRMSTVPLGVRTMAVKELIADRVGDVQFTLDDSRPGTNVYDATDPSGVDRDYTIPYSLRLSSRPPWYRSPLFLSGLSLAIALGVSGYVLWRRSRSSHLA